MDAPLRASFDAHLAGCPHCTHYLEQMRAMIRVAGTISADDLSPGSAPGCSRRSGGSRDEGRRRPRRPARRRRPRGAAPSTRPPVTSLKAPGFGWVLARADRQALYYWQREKQAGGKVRCTGYVRRALAAAAGRVAEGSAGARCRDQGNLRRDPPPRREAPGHLQPAPALRVRPRRPRRRPLRQRQRLVRRPSLGGRRALCRGRHGGRGSPTFAVKQPMRAKRARRRRGGPGENHVGSPRRKIQRAGGGFIHRFRWLSDSGLAALPVRPSEAASTYSRSVLAAHGNLGDGPGLTRPLRSECRKERKFPFRPDALLPCGHGWQRAVP